MIKLFTNALAIFVLFCCLSNWCAEESKPTAHKLDGVKRQHAARSVMDLPYVLFDHGLSTQYGWCAVFETGWRRLPSYPHNWFGLSDANGVPFHYRSIEHCIENLKAIGVDSVSTVSELFRWMQSKNWNPYPGYYKWCSQVVQDNPYDFAAVVQNADKYAQ